MPYSMTHAWALHRAALQQPTGRNGTRHMQTAAATADCCQIAHMQKLQIEIDIAHNAFTHAGYQTEGIS
jgi:hypothetical protein